MIDLTTFAEDNAKKLPFATMRNLQKAVKKFLQSGEVEMATSIFDAIKIYFKA